MPPAVKRSKCHCWIWLLGAPLSAHLSAAIVSVRTGQSSTSSCHYFPNSDLPRPSKYGLKSERATVDCAIVKPSLKRLTMNV